MKIFLSFLVVIIAGAIASYYIFIHPSQKPAVVNKPTTDTVVIVKESIINAKAFDTIPAGFYQGMLPCKTCEGIQRTILFSSDEHFKMEELNWGKGTQAKRTEGSWEKENGKFVLYLNDKVLAKYRLTKDSLINIENNGTRIPDSLSNQYVLFKKNTAPENISWKERKSQGIDIIGNGGDPYWSIEIDNEKFIYFKLSPTDKPVIVPIEKPVVTKDSTYYSIVTEAGAPLKISISSKFCSDGLSDHLYEHKMSVWYKDKSYKGCAVILHPAGQD